MKGYTIKAFGDYYGIPFRDIVYNVDYEIPSDCHCSYTDDESIPCVRCQWDRLWDLLPKHTDWNAKVGVRKGQSDEY